MMNMSAAPSLADIAAVTNNNDGFNGGNGWWILIILFAIFGGWGRGYGYDGGGSTQGAAQNYVLASDFATLQRQIDSGVQSLERKGDNIINGLSNGFYTEAQLINGLDKSIANGNYALSTQLNTLSAAQQACCCDIRNQIGTGFADVAYRMATDTCAINTNIANSIRNVIDNDNANYRALDARLTAMEMSAKDDKIASLTADNQTLRFAASQSDQNNYLISQLKQCPVPAYVVPNPYCNCNNNTCVCNG